MSDPNELLDEIAAAEDAFGHADGRPRFEPGLNASPDASEGEVQIQTRAASWKYPQFSTPSATTTVQYSSTRSS